MGKKRKNVITTASGEQIYLEPSPCDDCFNRPICQHDKKACVRFVHSLARGAFSNVPPGATFSDWILPHREIYEFVFEFTVPPKGFREKLARQGLRTNFVLQD